MLRSFSVVNQNLQNILNENKLTQKETFTKSQISDKNAGYRLGQRRDLFERRKKVTDYTLLFSLFGVFLMILDLELIIHDVYLDTSNYSLALKSLIFISTMFLITFILVYHALEIKIFSWDDSIEDWKIAITWQRIVQMIVEVVICSIQPIPVGNLTFTWTIENERKEISWNLVVALPMLLRFYLLFRVILLHSKLFTDAGSRSIGAMNKVSFNISFVLKTAMTTDPGTILLIFILFIWIVFSWTMRICEYTYDENNINLLNTMYLVAITFLSVGYGDIVPHTYCGRGISILSGVTGAACTALTVAVFARRLTLSTAEKHVIHFMFENQLCKKLKYFAANVLRETWLIYKYTKLVKRINPILVRVHQRKFLRAIHGMRQVKTNQRKLQTDTNMLLDLSMTQSDIYTSVTNIRIEQDILRNKLDGVNDNLLRLRKSIENLTIVLQEGSDKKV